MEVMAQHHDATDGQYRQRAARLRAPQPVAAWEEAKPRKRTGNRQHAGRITGGGMVCGPQRFNEVAWIRLGHAFSCMNASGRGCERVPPASSVEPFTPRGLRLTGSPTPTGP